MKTLIGKLAARSRTAAAKALGKLETKILVAAGRRSVRKRIRAVAAVSRKAAKAGAITGTLVAAGVVARQIRKRRRD